MSNGPPKKTKVRRLAKILGAVVLLVIGFLVFANIQDVNTKNSEEATPLHYGQQQTMRLKQPNCY